MRYKAGYETGLFFRRGKHGQVTGAQFFIISWRKSAQ
jgi:hypothetical protein